MQRVRNGLKILLTNRQEFLRRLKRLLRPMRQPYRRRWGMSLRRWLIYHQTEVVFRKCSWMGVRTLKNPLDAWIYQELIYRIKPDVIIEIGSAEGGSTLFFAHLLELMGGGEVLSIDIDRARFKTSHPRIVEITGDSSSPEVVAQVRDRCRGKTVFAIHDGDHTRTQVLKDLRLYAPFVTPGSYLVVEDGTMDLFRPGDGMGQYQEGPIPAIDQFLRENPDFTIDMEPERYLLTLAPQGFLKRVR